MDTLTPLSHLAQDGKTVLHLAAAKRNVPIVKLVIEAGAKIDVPDKKGVRAIDTITWTDVVYPAIACPLQNAVFKLEQRNAALEDHMRALHEVEVKTKYASEMVVVESENAGDYLESCVRYEASLERQTDRTIQSVREAEACIRSHGPRMALVEVETQTAANITSKMIQQIEMTKAKSSSLEKRSTRLHRRHTVQLHELSVAEKQCAVKCEAVEMMGHLDRDQTLQDRFLRALLVMCKRLDVAKKLSMGGLQGRVLGTLQHHCDHPVVVGDGIRVVLLLCEIKQRHHSDPVISAYIKPWPLATLLRAIESAVLRSVDCSSLHDCYTGLLQVAEQAPELFEEPVPEKLRSMMHESLT